MSKLLDLLYRARSEPYGLAVSGLPSDRLKQSFYAVRRKANDPDLDNLSFLTSVDDPANEVLVVNKGASNAEG